MHTKRNLLRDLSLTGPHPPLSLSFFLPVPCWRSGSSSLVWWQCPWHTLSSYNGLIFIPSTLKVETFIKWSLSLSLSQPFPLLPCLFRVALSWFCTPFPSLTALSLLAGARPKTSHFPLPRFKLLFLLCPSCLVLPSWCRDHLPHDEHTLVQDAPAVG